MIRIVREGFTSFLISIATLSTKRHQLATRSEPRTTCDSQILSRPLYSLLVNIPMYQHACSHVGAYDAPSGDLSPDLGVHRRPIELGRLVCRRPRRVDVSDEVLVRPNPR